VNVLYGSSGVGLTATGDQFWHQGSSLLEADKTSALLAFTPNGETPIGTALHQGYPNPFTTGCTFQYYVAEPGWVRIAVYDLFGREMMVLADGVVEAGSYAATLNGLGLSPGVYLVRMTTDRGFSQDCQVMRIK
jgi:hypothetical protein